MKYDLDQPISRKGTHSLKWEFMMEGENRVHIGLPETADGKKPLIPMWVADMDFSCPPAVIDALVRRARQGIYGYSYPTDSYFDALTGWIQRRHGWTLEREWVVLTPGIVPALKMLVQTFIAPGEKVLIQPPVYHPFFHAIERNGCLVAPNPLILEKDGYRIDFDGLARVAADPDVKMAFLCSPHNPVGKVWPPDELHRFGEICLANDILVVADEVYCDLIYPGHTFFSYAKLGDPFLQNSVICRAASKTFNLAGLKTSNIIIPDPARRERFSATIDRNAGFNVNTFGIVAAEAAFNHGAEWLSAVMEYVAENYHFMVGYLAEHLPQLKVIPPQGTYLVWVDFRSLGMDPAARKRFMLDEARLLLDEGEMFGSEGQGFERFNIACPRETLEEGLARIRAAVTALA